MIKSRLIVISTNYRYNIMQEYPTGKLKEEHDLFVMQVNEIIPGLNLNKPFVAIGVEDSSERWAYSLAGGPYFKMDFGDLPNGTIEDKAQFLDSLVTGEHESSMRLNERKRIKTDMIINSDKSLKPIVDALKNLGYLLEESSIDKI